MPGTYPYLQHGPSTCEVSVTVLGGQLVMPDSTTKKVKPATAGAVTVLGVALADGAPAGSGNNLSFGTNRPTIAVGRACEVPVTYSSDAAFGDKLIAGATGSVVVGTATAGNVVGQCTEPAGVVSGAVGRAWIF
jgi:hypothetical protein